MDRIFEPFFTSKPEGLGLGLAICRSIMRAHGGRIGATTNSHGGATFYVEFPSEPTAPSSDTSTMFRPALADTAIEAPP